MISFQLASIIQLIFDFQFRVFKVLIL